ncbi:MAG: hypothetical protein ACOYCB_13220 [Fastidiosipilaceae bacterium]
MKIDVIGQDFPERAQPQSCVVDGKRIQETDAKLPERDHVSTWTSR